VVGGLIFNRYQKMKHKKKKQHILIIFVLISNLSYSQNLSLVGGVSESNLLSKLNPGYIDRFKPKIVFGLHNSFKLSKQDNFHLNIGILHFPRNYNYKSQFSTTEKNIAIPIYLNNKLYKKFNIDYGTTLFFYYEKSNAWVKTQSFSGLIGLGYKLSPKVLINAQYLFNFKEISNEMFTQAGLKVSTIAVTAHISILQKKVNNYPIIILKK
jgi:hypothetical protein